MASRSVADLKGKGMTMDESPPSLADFNPIYLVLYISAHYAYISKRKKSLKIK